MVLTRATTTPGPTAVGTADDATSTRTPTTPFVDQNQTYTSHPSHQVFLREYVLDATARPRRHRRRLLDGANGGLATWAEVKAQARDMLGIELDRRPTSATCRCSRPTPTATSSPAPNGFPQLVDRRPDARSVDAGASPDGPVDARDAAPSRTGHAFLDDIAHTRRAGRLDRRRRHRRSASATRSTADDRRTYDNELLDAHFVTGDGRGNENIGLTAVHHVFHAEHNRLVEHIKDVVLATERPRLPRTSGCAVDARADPRPTASPRCEWNGERLFQAAQVRHRDAVPAPRLRGVRPQGPAEHRRVLSARLRRRRSTRRSSPSSRTSSTASATRC